MSSIVSQGVHGSGGRAFSPQEYASVVDLLRQSGGGTVAAISAATGVAGRTVREIISAADGVHILVGSDGREGYTVPETRQEAERHTAKLASQVARMAERVERRRQYALNLPDDDLQPGLFEEAL